MADIFGCQIHDGYMFIDIHTICYTCTYLKGLLRTINIITVFQNIWYITVWQ